MAKGTDIAKKQDLERAVMYRSNSILESRVTPKSLILLESSMVLPATLVDGLDGKA